MCSFASPDSISGPAQLCQKEHPSAKLPPMFFLCCSPPSLSLSLSLSLALSLSLCLIFKTGWILAYKWECSMSGWRISHRLDEIWTWMWILHLPNPQFTGALPPFRMHFLVDTILHRAITNSSQHCFVGTVRKSVVSAAQPYRCEEVQMLYVRISV